MHTLLPLFVLNQVPIPRDIPLPLPMAEEILIVILILSFLLHILFVNLMVGGTILCFVYEILGIKNKDYDTLAREIASTITVNKSLAIVLGVAPLLSINVLYTLYFYTANSLTGLMWISIIPWVTIAFLMLYWHKYSWKKMANNKVLHIGILGIALLSFIIIPLIFLVNINLMLYPEKWDTVSGFFSALMMQNVFPRYFHFMTASFAVTGIFLYWWINRKNFKIEKYTLFTRKELGRKFLNLALIASLSQLVFGPIVLFTLPAGGISWNMLFIIFGGIIAALVAMYFMYRSLSSSDRMNKINFAGIVVSLTITVILMGTGRHVFRANTLSPHQELVKIQTQKHKELVELAHEQRLSPQDLEAVADSPGESLFDTHCKICHSMYNKLVGPPLTEFTPLYKGKKAELKKWIKVPGRKRMDYPQMTGFPQLSDKQLDQLSDYILSLEL